MIRLRKTYEEASMRLESDPSPAGKDLRHIRLDRIGGMAGGLWWVAREFDDATTQPEGMFADPDEARRFAESLASELGVGVVVNDLAS